MELNVCERCEKDYCLDCVEHRCGEEDCTNYVCRPCMDRCDHCNDDICENCGEGERCAGEGCARLTCSSDDKDCHKEFGLELCARCGITYCSDCRYLKCSRDWEESCAECLKILGAGKILAEKEKEIAKLNKEIEGLRSKK